MTNPDKSVRSSDYESANPDWEPIGARLAEIRGRVPQRDMAKLLGVSPNTYSRLERGVRELGADKISLLVKRGWNANWLLTGEGPEKIQRQEPKMELDVALLAAAMQALSRFTGAPGMPSFDPLVKAGMLKGFYETAWHQHKIEGLPIDATLQSVPNNLPGARPSSLMPRRRDPE